LRRAARVDDNQAEIVAALRLAGCNVQSIAAVGGGCPDLIVGLNERVVVMEIKDGEKVPSARKLTKDEQKWHAIWADQCRAGVVVVVESVDDARRAMGLAVAARV